MIDNLDQYFNDILKKLSQIDYVRPGQFPNIDLYMDQVTTFINDNLTAIKVNDDDRILTKTMINNYAKNKILPPPEKKKYSKEHMICLVYIYYLKNVISISEIQDILTPLTNKFFNPDNNNDHITMEMIYNEVAKGIKKQLFTFNDDISAKLKVNNDLFGKIENEEDREFLQSFSMICMLSFDIFIKQQIVEDMISKLSPTELPKDNKKK